MNGVSGSQFKVEREVLMVGEGRRLKIGFDLGQVLEPSIETLSRGDLKGLVLGFKGDAAAGAKDADEGGGSGRDGAFKGIRIRGAQVKAYACFGDSCGVVLSGLKFGEPGGGFPIDATPGIGRLVRAKVMPVIAGSKAGAGEALVEGSEEEMEGGFRGELGEDDEVLVQVVDLVADREAEWESGPEEEGVGTEASATEGGELGGASGGFTGGQEIEEGAGGEAGIAAGLKVESEGVKEPLAVLDLEGDGYRLVGEHLRGRDELDGE
jgi:hypothetical protein